MVKRENELQKKLRDDDIQIPESLLPENIKKKLFETDTINIADNSNNAAMNVKNSKSFLFKSGYGIFTCMAAALIILCLIVPGTTKTNLTKQSEKTIFTAKATSTPANNNVSDVIVTNNYNTAYKAFIKYKKDQYSVCRKEAATDSYILNDAAKSNTGSSSVSNISNDNYNSSNNYSETNVRTQGVDEGDIVKTDGNYIYEYDNNKQKINIYSAKGKITEKVSSISLKSITFGEDDYTNLHDMYISDNKLSIVVSHNNLTKDGIKKLYEYDNGDFNNFNKASWNSWGIYCCVKYNDDVASSKADTEKQVYTGKYSYAWYTRTLVYDIASPEKPELLHSFFQDGEYINSRRVGNTLYILSNRTFQISENLKKDEENMYIPQIGGKCVADKDVWADKKHPGNIYTLIASVNLDDCTYIDNKAVLGGTDNLYMSSQSVFMTDYAYSGREITHILKYTYKDGILTQKASGKVKGYILNDYSIDEKNGYLRIVTSYYTENGKQYNGLFIFDENLNLTGKLTNLAEDEQIYSARFIDNTAYFVTYRNTDPLFAVDVSNPNAPKMLGYLKIPGFSEYLHPWSDTLLLGIGMETDEDSNVLGLKMSMFDISDPANIREVNKKVLSQYIYGEFEYNPNALFIDTQKGIFGFSAYSRSHQNSRYYNNENNDYLVFSYNAKTGFERKLKYSLCDNQKGLSDYNYIGRGLYINDLFYVVSVGRKIDAFELKSLTE